MEGLSRKIHEAYGQNLKEIIIVINDIFIFNNKHVCIYQPLCMGKMWHKVNFKQILTRLKLNFFFSLIGCLIKAKEPSLSYYLPFAGGRIIRFIPFSRVLVVCEMPSALYRIWTHVTVSISNNDNHYTMVTSI